MWRVYHIAIAVCMLLQIGPVNMSSTELGCYGEYCYQYFSEEASAEEATEKCEEAGMMLVTIESLQKKQLIDQMIQDNAAVVTDSFWIGAKLTFVQKSGTDCIYVEKDDADHVTTSTDACSGANKYVCLNRFLDECWKSSPPVFNTIDRCPESRVYNSAGLAWDAAHQVCTENIPTPGHVGSSEVEGEIFNLAPRLTNNERYWLIYTVWNWQNGIEVTYDNISPSNIYGAIFKCMYLKIDDPEHYWFVNGCAFSKPYICQQNRRYSATHTTVIPENAAPSTTTARGTTKILSKIEPHITTRLPSTTAPSSSRGSSSTAAQRTTTSYHLITAASRSTAPLSVTKLVSTKTSQSTTATPRSPHHTTAAPPRTTTAPSRTTSEPSTAELPSTTAPSSSPAAPSTTITTTGTTSTHSFPATHNTTTVPNTTERPNTTALPSTTKQKSTTSLPSTTEIPNTTSLPSTTEKPTTTTLSNTTEHHSAETLHSTEIPNSTVLTGITEQHSTGTPTTMTSSVNVTKSSTGASFNVTDINTNTSLPSSTAPPSTAASSQSSSSSADTTTDTTAPSTAARGTESSTITNFRNTGGSTEDGGIDNILLVCLLVGAVLILAILIIVIACVCHVRNKSGDPPANQYDRHIDHLFQEAVASEVSYVNGGKSVNNSYATHINEDISTHTHR